jgi:hypothetical protein
LDHLVVETPEPNLVYGMKRLLWTYTKRFNIRHQLCGQLFAERYQVLVEHTRRSVNSQGLDVWFTGIAGNTIESMLA